MINVVQVIKSIKFIQIKYLRHFLVYNLFLFIYIPIDLGLIPKYLGKKAKFNFLYVRFDFYSMDL